jgi:hypothetical protein
MSGIISYTAFGGKSGIIGPLPSFSAGLTSNHSSGVIIWGIAHNNAGGHYNTSTGKFTAPVTGKYWFSFFCMSGASDHTLDIEMTGSITGTHQFVPYSGATGSNYNQCSGQSIVGLAAGQYIQLICSTGIYGTTGGRHGGFSGHLIG